MKILKYLFQLTLLTFLFSSCTVGPNYVRPSVQVPKKFKETPKGWKIAQPNDDFDRGQWWEIFHDQKLNELEAKLNISNQTIANAQALYRQARALVDQARASYFPTLAVATNIVRQKAGSFNVGSSAVSQPGSTTSTNSSNTSLGTTIGARGSPFTTEALLLNASWEPDLWGSVSRKVEANVDAAQASAASLGNIRLSAQASLAQYYFELRGVDRDIQLSNATVIDYRKALRLTENQYASGVAGQADIVQARSQLEAAEAQAINYGVSRAQYEHAIAVLIGVPVSNFSIPPDPLHALPPMIPTQLPSALLERRPDVAQAERLMAQANAQIGIAISAYFPALTISSGGSMLGIASIGNWLTHPLYGWSIGMQLAETLFDGGLRNAITTATRAAYDANVATYRQTVLAAFQDVEDNLAALRILKKESVALNKAAADARLALRLVINQYKAGTVAYSNVIVAQTNAYTAEKNAADTMALRMTSSVGLIKALGGGWSYAGINNTASG